ncbi:MAG TPA: TadE/TadG family type IV pilus assembly protein [Tetrasphaera sp.]|uniref:TadE family protein n=1 Tax=Nostocoides sp. TaxID=1917966 RepID=UPI002C9C3AA4|nr:TadE/TadG family type IV pilus assembly protein [Tetrasphaera sp.]HNQ07337.1 TadE/TadG family type IV pilus assembly protein [Tetrasphaera sp.]
MAPDHRPRPGRGSCEDGAAVADFAMVAGLLLVVFAAVFQLGLALHIRNTLISCAAEGARLGARADAIPEDAIPRTRELINRSLSTRFSQDITVSTESVGGVALVVVRVSAPLPVFGPLGPDGQLEVVGRAFEERQ